MKKIFAITLVLSIVGGILAGCKKDGEGTDAAGTTTGGTTAPATTGK